MISGLQQKWVLKKMPQLTTVSLNQWPTDLKPQFTDYSVFSFKFQLQLRTYWRSFPSCLTFNISWNDPWLVIKYFVSKLYDQMLKRKLNNGTDWVPIQSQCPLGIFLNHLFQCCALPIFIVQIVSTFTIVNYFLIL